MFASPNRNTLSPANAVMQVCFSSVSDFILVFRSNQLVPAIQDIVFDNGWKMYWCVLAFDLG